MKLDPTTTARLEAAIRNGTATVTSGPKAAPAGAPKPRDLLAADVQVTEYPDRYEVRAVVPLFLPSTANGGKLDRAAIGRAGSQRKAVAEVLCGALRALAPIAETRERGQVVHVRIVRHGAGMLDDDNLASAAKYVRDTVALFLSGGDDGPDAGIRWHYGQGRGKTGVQIVMWCELNGGQ